uniref:Reelin domain-containing protein n=1 Tax=Paramormyrops kingsleyae TaxID=1676925 RepID=A0A3B3SX18_9TELE
ETAMPGEVLLAAFLLQLPPLASSYPTGAPASACADMTPHHGGAQAQATPAPYTIYISNHTFRVDEPITVTIKGPNYTGLLLRAQSSSRADALGVWQPPPANTKYLHCSGNAHGAITHSNIEGTTGWILFQPELTASVSLCFRATVAQEKTVFWVNIKSESLTRGELK